MERTTPKAGLSDGWEGGAPAPPSLLPGEFWGVCAHFNPTGQDILVHNLQIFATRCRAQGLKLLVVELAFADRPFQLADDVADMVLRRRTDTVLWHKERLLNLGIDHLPPACDKVAWLDGDILFDNADWVAQTALALKHHAVVQPFDTACWLPRPPARLPAEPPMGLDEGCALPGMAARMAAHTDRRRALADYFQHGHTGFAWAARRDLLARHHLYDRHILGGGDVTLAHAFFGDADYWRGRNVFCRGMSKAEIAAAGRWGQALFADIATPVGHVPGRVLHLWHGRVAARGYMERARVLTENGFDPDADIRVDDDGVLCWTSDKPGLHRGVHDYFHRRNHR